VKLARLLLGFSIAGLIVGSLALYIIGGVLVSPKVSVIGDPPINLPIEVVRIPKVDDTFVSGWFIQGAADRAGILLLHGVRADRREMIARAEFLFFRESVDVHYSLDYLRRRVDGRKIGVIGSSMGGAAALLGDRPIDVDAVILEGVFGTLEQAIENRIRIRLGDLAALLAPLLSMQLEPRLGISLKSVSPADAVSNLRSPVLIVSGTEDKHALPAEAQAIYDAANEPKNIWFIKGAAHQDLHRYNQKSYEKRVLQFFSKYLN